MWFLCQRVHKIPRDQWTVTLDQHLVWMKRMHDEGRNLLSGPTPDRKIGMYLIRAGSKEDAETIASSDPYTVAGHTRFDLIAWEIHQIMGAGEFTGQAMGR